MTNPPHVRLTAGAAAAFVLAFVAVVASDVELDGTVLVLALLVAAVVRLMDSAQQPSADGGDYEVSNRVRAGILMAGFVAFLLFSQPLRTLVERTANATVGLGLLYLITTLFVTRRTLQIRIVWLTLAATVVAMGVGVDLWWLLPLAAACALAASGNLADVALPTLGTATTPGRGATGRATLGKALGFALIAALLALWWQPNPPSNSGSEPLNPGGTPIPPGTTLVPAGPVEESSPPWLLILLLLLLFVVLVVLALLLWRYLRRRRQPWSTRALRRFTKAGRRLGVPIAASDTLHQFAQRFPDVVGDLPTRIANALDSTTYSRRSPGDLDAQVEPELQSLERLAKTHQHQHRRDRLGRLFRRPRAT